MAPQAQAGSGFSGIEQSEHEALQRAAKLYAGTGEDVTGVVDKIPVKGESEEDKSKKAEAKNKLDEESLQSTAEAQAALEKAQQEARQIQARTDEQGNVWPEPEGAEPKDVQPGNPGAGQPAMATEKAKAQGMGRQGEERKEARPANGR
jgi:hypothetical protein